MMAALARLRDGLLGRGEAVITVPVLDGALKPNNLLEQAESLVTLPEANDLASDGNNVYVAAGERVLRLGGSEAIEERRFGAPVTALACLRDGGIVVALDGQELRVAGGVHDGRRWRSVAGRPLHAVNALSVSPDGRLLVTDGSQEHPAALWKHDLMALGRTGRLLAIDLQDQSEQELAAGLRHAFGACASEGATWVSESWQHRILRIARDGTRTPVTDPLPGYPGRMSPASGGGCWVTCFAMRTLLVEFVLHEHAYRQRMIEEIDPRYWIAPALSSGHSFLEPMQGAQLKTMGVVKPWAPPRSYGLVMRLDADGTVRNSLHSRFDGSNHGVVAAVESGGALYLLAKGPGRILRVKLADIEGGVQA